MSLAQEDTVPVHDALWSQRVRIVSDKLHVLCEPALHGRIECGTALAMQPDKVKVSGGRWRIADENGQWQTVNGACTCQDYKEAPQGLCKHRAAAMIVRDAQAIPDEDLSMREPGEDEEDRGRDEPGEPRDVGVILSAAGGAEDAATVAAGHPGMFIPPASQEGVEEVAQAHKVKAEHIVLIHGRPFIRYIGLLNMAHEQGLQSLKASFISVTADLALAEAVATFADGRQFLEAADATPDNVTPMVKLHFPRVALTRAKARVLRDALGVSLCSLEEMELEPDPARPVPTPGGEGWCPKHGLQMPLQKNKDGETWYSHRLTEGTWCKGK